MDSGKFHESNFTFEIIYFHEISIFFRFVEFDDYDPVDKAILKGNQSGHQIKGKRVDVKKAVRYVKSICLLPVKQEVICLFKLCDKLLFFLNFSKQEMNTMDGGRGGGRGGSRGGRVSLSLSKLIIYIYLLFRSY